MITHLNLNQLRGFHFVAKYGNLSQAAQKLMVTQSAVSMQIKALQAYYEVRLFRKKNNRLELADFGMRLYSITQKIFELVEHAEQLMMSGKGYLINTLNIGITRTFFHMFFIPLLSSYQSAFPNIKIHIQEGNSLEIMQSVLKNHNELAVVGRVNYPKIIQFIKLLERPLFLIMPPGHRLCQKKGIFIEDIKAEPIIMKDTGSATRMLFEKACKKKRFFPTIILETGNDECIGNLVKDGRGISIVHRELFIEEIEKHTVIALPFQDQDMMLPVDIVFKKGKKLSSAATSLLHFIRKNIKKIKFTAELLPY